MAKKKSKKKEGKKKDISKKKIKKLDLIKKKLKKKASKKKGTKKKDTKKKPKKHKSREKQHEQILLTVTADQPKAQNRKVEDHSSNYNVSDAIKQLRSIKSIDELMAFTKGEKRLTIIKVIPAAKNRLNKV